MKKTFSGLLSMILVLCMIISLFSGVYAAPSATEIITTPSGYTSASSVVYQTVDGHLANWGARGEDCTFLSTYANSFYTGSYAYGTLSKLKGGTSTSTAPSSALYSSLQSLMVDNHTYFTRYGSTNSNDCKYIYQYTDCMLGDPSYVSTLYRGERVGGVWDSGSSYNQEHIWPQSKCIGGNSEDVGDIMHLRPANPSENSSRGNKSYGLSSGFYDPGVSVRGDCARTVLYMYVRWGNTDNMWGTDGVIESLDILLNWIQEDPVDTWEMGHNDAVQSITGTRNVFVDYPEYAWLLFGQTVPTDLATPSNGQTDGSGSGTGTVPETVTAELVTNASSLKAGDQIIIAALDYDFALGTTQNTNNRSRSVVTKGGTTLTAGTDTQILTLQTGTAAGTFALEADGQYLSAVSSSENYLRTKDTLDDAASWTIGIDSATSAASVVASGSYTRNVMRYNSSSALFSCYSATNTQKDLAIYKLNGTDQGGDSGNTGTGGSDVTGLVTSASSLKAGDQIVIAALDYDYALSTTQNTNNRGQASVTKSGSSITYGADTQILTLREGTVSGTFALETEAGSYLYAASSTSNQLKTTTTLSDNASWTISADSATGAATITACGTYTRNVMRYNTSSSLFSCYSTSNSQKDICIYKVGSASTAAKDYYLFGYINGADYGCEGDYQNMGQYRFTNGNLTATFTVDSYIGIKTTDNGDWYMTQSYCTDTTGVFYSTSTGAAEKMWVPGNVELTFTLTVNSDNTLTLSYVTAACDHSYTSKITTAATCTATGVRTYTCSKCGDSYTESIEATGHSYKSVVTAPTCTAQGYTTYTCSTCGSSYKGTYTAATGHSYTSKVTTAATCTKAGVRTYTCSKCGDSYTESIAATGHSFVSGKCTVCGTVDPDCSHSYTSKVTTAATCTTTGLRTYTCSMCGSSYTETIAATGHSYVGGSCTSCGAADPNAPTGNQTYYLFGYINGANYACEEDYENMGQYKFVDGTLTTTFASASYVAVKTEGNGAWYMTEGWQGNDVTSVTLYNTDTLFSADKLYVPGGVQVTFTLTENADGTLTLSYTEASTEPSTAPTIGLKYPTVSFEDMILMNVYYSATDLEDVVEMGLITYTTKPDAPSVDTADQVIPGYAWSESDGFYFSTTAGIAPKDLGDTIHFAVYYKLADGTYGYTKVAGYSPKTYALGQLNTGTAEMKALVVAMLNYGAAAQVYFNYKTDSLMNATLTSAQKALVADYSADMIATVTQASGTKLGTFVNDNTYTKRYPTITFEGAFCINYYFQPSLAVKGDVTMYIWSLEDFNAASVLTKENATKAVKMELTETGEYLATVDGIAAKDLDKAAYVSFVYSDGTTEHCGGVLGYTIGMYCKSQASKTGTLADLAKACAVYGYYAKQLFNK